MSPSFDNNVLANDPFGKLKKKKMQIQNQSISPPRVIKHNIQHPKMPELTENYSMNNFSEFKNDSKLLNINAMQFDSSNSYDLDFDGK